MSDSTLTWYGDREYGHSGLENDVITCARVRYAEEGEAEGGLGALLRFTAMTQGATPIAPPAPAGWYWFATIEAIGVWTRPHGPFATAGDAIEDCNEAWANRPWRR